MITLSETLHPTFIYQSDSPSTEQSLASPTHTPSSWILILEAAEYAGHNATSPIAIFSSSPWMEADVNCDPAETAHRKIDLCILNPFDHTRGRIPKRWIHGHNTLWIHCGALIVTWDLNSYPSITQWLNRSATRKKEVLRSVRKSRVRMLFLAIII